MTYRIQTPEHVGDTARSLARKLAQSAIDSLADPSNDDIEGAVHDARKCCKKIRGLARLNRMRLGDAYGETNQLFRDAARELSPYRDAHALLETFDDLVAAIGEGGDHMGAVREQLAAAARTASAGLTDDSSAIAGAHEFLKRGKRCVEDWRVEGGDRVLCEGLERSYKRGHKALELAARRPTDDRLHEWRKRAKYTWYHVRLLQDAAPSVLAPLASCFHDLADALGDDHDLAVLLQQLHESPDSFGGQAVTRTAFEAARSARSDLQDRAFRLGWRLYQESPEHFAQRIGGYWKIWKQRGDERRAGETTSRHLSTAR